MRILTDEELKYWKFKNKHCDVNTCSKKPVRHVKGNVMFEHYCFEHFVEKYPLKIIKVGAGDGRDNDLTWLKGDLISTYLNYLVAGIKNGLEYGPYFRLSNMHMVNGRLMGDILLIFENGGVVMNSSPITFGFEDDYMKLLKKQYEDDKNENSNNKRL